MLWQYFQMCAVLINWIYSRLAFYVQYSTCIRVYAVGDEKFNRALKDDLRPFGTMYSDLKRKETFNHVL